ncbi:MAG: hypothetical protein IKI77_02905 [Oscillospiraceae bacterium]|nr:hypothetical protein [Oscillospiraceae bacterium]
MSKKSSYLRKTAAFAAALSFFAAANLTPVGVLAAEIADASAKKVSVAAQQDGQDQQDQQDAAVTTRPAATTEPVVTTTTVQTTTTVATTTTPAPVLQDFSVPLNISYGNVDKFITDKGSKNNIAEDLKNQIRNDLNAKNTGNVLKELKVETEKEDDLVKQITVSYKTYDTAAAEAIVDEVLGSAFTLIRDQKYYFSFTADQSAHKISCDQVFCRWITENDCKFSLNYTWAAGESVTVTNNKQQELYVKYGKQLDLTKFKPDTGYYLTPKTDTNSNEDQTPPTGITVSDQVELKNSGIYVGGKQIFERKDCIIKLTVNTDESVQKNYAPDSFSWAELNADTPELKFQTATDDKKVVIQSNNSNKKTYTVPSKTEVIYKLKTVLQDLNYKLEDLGKAKETSITLRISTLPSLFSVNVSFNDSEQTKTITVQQDNGIIRLPLLVKQDGCDYYLSSYTVERHRNTTDAPVDLTWEQVRSALNSQQSYCEAIYSDQRHWSAKKVNAVYTRIDSTENSIAVRELKAAFFGASQVNRNEHVMTWDFDRAFTFDCDMNNINILMIGSDQQIYQPTFTKIVSSDADEPVRYRLTLNVPRESVPNLRYLRVQSIFDSSSSENPIAIEGFDPFYIYVDHQAPVVNSARHEYKYGWSKTKSFAFRFSVSDDENPDNLAKTDDDLHALEQINQNEDLASVKELRIGDLVFAKPEDGWGSGDVTGMPVLESVTSEEIDTETNETISKTEMIAKTVPYSIKLSPEKNAEGVFSGSFKAVLTLNDTAQTYFNKTLPISASDFCGLDSNSQNIDIRIDTAAPTVSSITIDNLLDGKGGERVLKAGDTNGLVVHADVTDGTQSSNIRTVEMQYAGRDPKTAENVNQKNWNSEMKFDHDNTSRRGLVAVTVEDYAGNRSTYYYAHDPAEDADLPAASSSAATNVVTDFQKPSEPEFSELRTPDYTPDDQSRKWYKDYLDMPFSAADEGDIRSEIRTLKCRINDSSWFDLILRDYIAADVLTDPEIADLLKNNKFYLHFEADTKNNRAFHAYLSCAGYTDIKIPISEDLFRLKDSGDLTVETKSVDYAGNESPTAKQTIFIDNTDPSADTHFDAITHHTEHPIAQTKFGVFSSDTIHIRVAISDTDDNAPSSGIAEATLHFAEKDYTGEISEEYEPHRFIADFRIPVEPYIAGTATITVKDHVGRSFTSEALLSEKESTLIMLETNKPELPDPTVEGPNRCNGSDDKVWYSGDVKVTYSVTDEQSGLADVNFERIHQNGNHTDRIQKPYSDLDKKTTTGEYTLETQEGVDGQADFRIRVRDNAGNLSENTLTVYKDIQKPYVAGFQFVDTRSFASEHPDQIVARIGDRYGHFSAKTTTVRVIVRDDRGASSGIKSVTCALYLPDGTLYHEPVTVTLTDQNQIEQDGSRIVSFELPEGFKGDIAAWAVDNVNNNSDTFYTDGFAAENDTRHQATSHLAITLPQTDKRDVSGLPLYNQNVTAKLTAEDSFSGIQFIEWSTSDFEDWQRVDINQNGDVIGEGWTVTQKDRNLAVKAEADLTVIKDANADFIRLRITDNSGNTSEDSVSFSIDKQAPHITVGGLNPSQQTAYYNHDITANVAIAERNFAAPTVNGGNDGGYAADPNSPENTDQYIHAKQYVYNTDGTYSLTVDDVDLAGNATDSAYRSGDFVIDKTAPQAALTFRRQSGGAVDPKKNPYISEAVSATFTVTELNFDPARAVVSINGQNYVPDAKDWKTEQNNVHILTIPAEKFTDNQRYTVAASATDLAGNSSGTMTAEFVVDTVDPEIEISGFTAANKDRVAPVVKSSDENYSEWELRLTRNGEECTLKTDDGAGTFTFAVPGTGKTISGHWETLDSGKTRRFTFDDFPHEEAFDGAYKLTLTVTDQSGRKTSETGEFTVNRFGSVFTVTDYEEINRKHLPQAQDIEIVERNVDLHADDSEIIVVVDKGSATVQLKDDDYTVSEPVLLDDKSGYEYTYIIKAENFSQDLDYKITISTTDAAGNANVSTNRGAELDFTVDTHVPEFICDDLFDRAEYRESEKEFRLNVNEPLRSIRVTTSDNEVLLDEEDDSLLGLSDTSFSFSVPASNNSRMITVELQDLAGNTTKKEFENLLVTENMALYMLHKTWVRKVGTGGLAGVGGIGAFLGIRNVRRKKNGF